MSKTGQKWKKGYKKFLEDSTIRLKWKEGYRKFLENPVEVYYKRILESVRLIEKYKRLIEYHKRKIERLRKLINVVKSGKFKKPENLEALSLKYMEGIGRFLGLEEEEE